MSDSFLFPTNDVKNKNRKKLFGDVTLRNHRHAYPLGWPARSLCMFLYDFEVPPPSPSESTYFLNGPISI